MRFSTATATALVTLIKEEYGRLDRSRKVRTLDRLAKDEHVTKAILDRGRKFIRSMPGATVSRRVRRPVKRTAD